MCGRFTLVSSSRDLAEWFQLAAGADFADRFNIAPRQDILALVFDPAEGRRVARVFHWGLVPFWAKDISVGNRMINVRAETVFDKPAFRTTIRQRRCLIPADGFYEWERDKKSGNRPFYFCLKEGLPFAFAGLWERWESPEGGSLLSCAIITIAANSLIASIHPRMPVILEPNNYGLWLDPAVQDRAPLEALLQPFPAERMTSRPVSTRVNSPYNEGPGLLEPVG